jgi:hypothetical protein
MGHGDEHHEPALLLPKDYVDRSGSYRRGWGPVRIPDKDGGNEYYIFLLGRQDLFIGGDKEAWEEEANLEMIYSNISTDGCTGDADSLGWVASMSEVYTSAGAAKQRFLKERIEPELGARVLLTRGRVSSGPIPAGSPRWGFESEPMGSAGVHRALAESVLYSLHLDTGARSLALTTRHFATDSVEKILVQFPSDDTRVEGRVLNMPWLDILQRRSGNPSVDVHFAHFYDLAERPPRVDYRRLPYRESSCPGASTMKVTDPKCPPAFFAPDETV